MLTLLGALMLGWLLGMRHALEPDHLAAVSNIVVAGRRPSAGATVGLLWGLGHTGALLAVGVALGLLRAGMPRMLAELSELGVAVMLVALGARSIRGALVAAGEVRPGSHVHAHGVEVHAHPGQPDHLHLGALRLSPRPLLIGLVHGLAGSGALTALAVANMPTLSTRLVFMGVFGVGSIMGMALLAGLAGWPLAGLGRNARVARTLSLATGAFSLGLGALWGLPILRELMSR